MAGNITIIEPTENFQRVSKDIVFNEEVDVFTLGLYVKVLVLGKTWKLNIKGMAAILHVSTERIKKAFALLEKMGYIKRVHIKDEKTGYYLGYDYHIGAVPFPEDERTDLQTECSSHHKIQPLENPAAGESSRRKIQLLENTEAINRDNKETKTIKENKDNNISISPSINRSPSFSLRSALLAAGVTAEVADAWLAVRKAKKAVNTELAWKAIEREIQKSGRSADECIRFSAERSWAGFKADWIKEETTTRKPSPRPPFQTATDRMLALAAEEFGFKPDYDEQ